MNNLQIAPSIKIKRDTNKTEAVNNNDKWVHSAGDLLFKHIYITCAVLPSHIWGITLERCKNKFEKER